MFNQCFARVAASSEAASANPDARSIELFVPGREETSRQESFRWHVATRNFFAFIMGKPLVGAHLGQAMVDLQERMQLYRSSQVNNHQDFLLYADTQGYRDFVDCPDYALAILYYSEHFKLRDVWVDAFAHCVGMNDRLVLSPEFAVSHYQQSHQWATLTRLKSQSSLTKGLITRASLEMDIKLDRSTRAVRNFLEDDLSSTYLGLTNDARLHLDRFRSFLNTFYVDKFGYWPPPKKTTFSKALYRSLYFDFKSLYDYLVDKESTGNLANQRLASGGICVLQNVASFDSRHKFQPLSHPLPLLPEEVTPIKRVESQKSLRSFTLRSKQDKNVRRLAACAALLNATNSENASQKGSIVIERYVQFEQQSLSRRDEKISLADARKVKWLLIYGTLQYLSAALHVPAQVRDADGPNYHLCCAVAENAQWKSRRSTISTLEEVKGTYSSLTSLENHPADPNRGQIEPDSHARAYLLHTNTDPGSRRASIELPAPPKVEPCSRSLSVRLARRVSMPSLRSKRNKLQLKSQPHCQILVQGYGNGLNSASAAQSRRASITSIEVPRLELPLPSDNNGLEASGFEFDFPKSTPSKEPSTPPSEIIHDCMIMPEQLLGSIPGYPKVFDSPESLTRESSIWSAATSLTSSRSSTSVKSSKPNAYIDDERFGGQSGLLGGLVSVDTFASTCKRSDSKFSKRRTHSPGTSKRSSRRNSLTSFWTGRNEA